MTIADVVGVWDDDRLAANTIDDPDRVRLRTADAVLEGGTARLTLEPVSWVAVAFDEVGPSAWSYVARRLPRTIAFGVVPTDPGEHSDGRA